jgi:hypothetical protein
MNLREEEICLGHISRNLCKWCGDCIYDDKNKQCHFYQPVKLHIVEPEKIDGDYSEYIGHKMQMEIERKNVIDARGKND